MNKTLQEKMEILEIDGSVLEGGGQILRITISLSAILGIPVKVTKIRAGRSKPGLAAQHLKGIELVASMCNGKLKGASIGSTEVEFIPGKLKSGKFLADAKTAGSTSLMLQVSLPCALFAPGPVSLDLRGGTNAAMAPQIDYMNEVFRHYLKYFGGDFDLDIQRRGYFPKGGGRVTVDIEPVTKLNNIELTEPGAYGTVYGHSYVAGTLPIKMAHESAEGAKSALRDYGVTIDVYKEPPAAAPDNGSGILLMSKSSTSCVLASDGLGSRGAASRDVGLAAGTSLATLLASHVCVDSHCQDQIIVYMALARGRSVVRTGEVTLHTQTAIYIAELIAKVKFTVKSDGDQNLISCEGLGFVNTQLQRG